MVSVPLERDRQIYRRVVTRRMVLRRAKAGVAVAHFMSLARDVWRLPPTHLHYIPNGIDHQRFTPDDRVFARAARDRLRGRVTTGKKYRPPSASGGSCQNTHRFNLVIAGEGPDRDRLESLSRSLALNTKFLGNVQDPAPLYRSFAIFSLASDTEQMPLSVLEAMASGLPIAATCVGDINSMVAVENREFLTSRDDVALAKAIGGLLDDPERARSIGCANRKRVDAEFGQEAMINHWRSLVD